MDLGIKGRVAMVAAATRGIGAAIARALAAEGAVVSVCGVDAGRVEAAGRALGAAHRAYRCDVASEAALAAWFEATRRELGEPAILVTNTGGPPAAGALAATGEQWRAGVEGTLLSAVRMTALAAPAMRRARWGRIVHVTSLVAKDPEPLLAISSTLRAGLSALCRLQAKELAADGITVNCLLPGHTATERQEHLLEVRAGRGGTTVAAERERAQRALPIARFARPEEIADVAAFLCSERASYVTGVPVLVDGGAAGGLA